MAALPAVWRARPPAGVPLWPGSSISQQVRAISRLRAPAMSASDDAEAPDREIQWMQPLSFEQSRKPSDAEERRVTPIFPLDGRFGATAYTPGESQSLNIFEPRYRTMYNDILMTGSRSFAMFPTNPAMPNQLAAVGVNLYLTDLKEVSQQTG